MSFEILDEEIFIKNKEKFEEKFEDSLEEFTSRKINWIPDSPSFNSLREKMIDIALRKGKMFFLAHSNDVIKGKPQIIHQTKQRIPLIKKVLTVKKGDRYSNYEPRELTTYKLFGDKLRKDEREIDNLYLDFWIYRLVNEEYEFYLFSETKMDEVSMIISGMEVPMSDLSELNSNLKLKRISRIFFVRDFEKDVKLIENKENLIEYSKELNEKYNWDYDGFRNFIFTNEDEKMYKYGEEFQLLRISQLLSGKYEGYPLHIMKIGPVGTGKTTEAETLSWKFQEDEGILEAGNSTFKALVPSFKEKPANLGFIARCNRVAIIDELMKMVQKSLREGNNDHNTYFGELNMLLEHKERKIGSGNDNSVKLKNNSKVFITTNPLDKKYNLSQHLNYIDNSTLSRMIIWVQDEKEVNMIYSKTGISKNEIFKKSTDIHPEVVKTIKNNENDQLFNKKSTEAFSRNNFFIKTNTSEHVSVDFSKENIINDFLTIYDSCNNFLVEIDENKALELFSELGNSIKQQFIPIFKSRGLHHLILVLDGLVKYRCLFKDYDSTFTPKDEDWDLTKTILTKMISNWEVQFQNNNLLA